MEELAEQRQAHNSKVSGKLSKRARKKLRADTRYTEREAIAAERQSIARERVAIEMERERIDLAWDLVERSRHAIRDELAKLIEERRGFERRKQGPGAVISDKVDARGSTIPEREKEEAMQRMAREEIEKMKSAWRLTIAETEGSLRDINLIKKDWERERERQLREKGEIAREREILERLKASTLTPNPPHFLTSPAQWHQLLNLQLPNFSQFQHFQELQQALATHQLPQPSTIIQEDESVERRLTPKKRHQVSEDNGRGAKTSARDGRSNSDAEHEEEEEEDTQFEYHETVPEDFEYPVDNTPVRTRRTWEERYEELKKFKHKYGHLYIPYSGGTKQLYEWASTQRKNHRKKILRKERFVLLDQLGFPWICKREMMMSSTKMSPPQPSLNSTPGSQPIEEPQPSSSLLSSLASLANSERAQGKPHALDSDAEVSSTEE